MRYIDNEQLLRLARTADSSGYGQHVVELVHRGSRA